MPIATAPAAPIAPAPPAPPAPAAATAPPVTAPPAAPLASPPVEDLSRFIHSAKDAEFAEAILGDLSTVGNVEADIAEAARLGGYDAPPAPAASSETPAEHGKTEGEIAAAAAAPAPLVKPPAEPAATVEPPATPKELSPLLQSLGDVHVQDADGDVPLDLLENIQVSYKASGKQVTHSLAHVIRRSQGWGYNEGLEAEANVARSELPTLKATNERLATQLASQAALNKALLESDEDLATAREAWGRINSPEERERRLTEENTQLRRALAAGANGHSPESAADSQDAAHSFVVGAIAPKIAAVVHRYPELVRPEEVFGRFAMDTDHLRVNGTIPRAHYAQALEILETRVLPYIEQVAEATQGRIERQAETRAGAKTAQLEAALKEAQAQSTIAKRALARGSGLVPSGQPPATNGVTPRRTKPIESADDAQAAILEDVAAAALQSMAPLSGTGGT